MVDGTNGCSVWSEALQRPLRAASTLKVLEDTTRWLGRARLTSCPDDMYFLPSLPTSLQTRQPRSSVAPCACQQALLFWALIQLLTPMSKHSTTCEVCLSGLLLTDNTGDAVIPGFGKFQSLFLFQTTLQLCRALFSLPGSHSCHWGQAKHLHALTNPVYHLLRFHFLNNCKFLNLGLDWKTGCAPFFLREPTATGMDKFPAILAENRPLCPCCALPSITTAHHGAVTPAGCTSECSQVQVHPADTEFNSDFWRHMCTGQQS